VDLAARLNPGFVTDDDPRSRHAQRQLPGAGSSSEDPARTGTGPGPKAGGRHRLGEAQMRLENKVALITGGYGGMGRASARLFAQEGATVFVAGRSQERGDALRSEEHTSELQSRGHLVCRLLLEKKKKKRKRASR